VDTGVPGSGASVASSVVVASGRVCFQSRQIDTWLCPARSPAVCSPDAVRTVRSTISPVSSAIGVPVR
jgi:hypothetical protein